MMDKEHEATRDLLLKSTTAATPAGLEDRVLLSLAAEVDRRVKKRAALSGLLKYTAIGLLVIAIAQSLLPGGTAKTLAQSAEQLTENPGGKIVWLLKNTYFVVPLLALYIFSKIYRLKAG